MQAITIHKEEVNVFFLCYSKYLEVRDVFF